ncbi:break repair meiotic recombinase recruitment factor 1 isoform X1 [Cervus elaphus]|uniref:break repair meiotic recombinase recruitment factor 1 isoform X1 n=1 Tax=Cervus canadensis TaxID=1574408 RepID=UPI001C9E62CE|nr:break repair meiotic recombinase recruitment factor 1 isoform X1 [Cervus canadensis]XP_043322822.1 break repair meiotic recombinase recruitment factor 1 isoform X1 [Cervus canadensis]XP_043322823.1 break repair meiotic recombinase recruitment factor 1 isoform X1 [Cervus canadensis]XP_043767197.1 break repair meiotic recombinase recruitment factor 1 isoform X1 [Cervus elaphus]XP_043767198.1 break repair meiotic recombinase recruitment factor 1 isoform X1 [Cervus elaphus]XP_043767199.1 break 
MSKRKKLRTSGREGLHLPKLPKNPRIEDSDRATSQSSMLDYLHHPEESEGGSGLTPSAEQSGEEPGQAASSSPDNEADAPSRLLGQPEKEPVPLAPSQNSVGRFVPQFAKPRKTVTRQAERRAEGLGTGVFSSGTLPELSAQQTRSQPQDESPGLALQEARDAGHQTQADGPCTEPSGLSPVTPGPSDVGPQPSVSTSASPESGMVPSASERAGQDHLSEPRTSVPKGGSTEEGWAPGNHGQKGPLPGSDAEETEPEREAPQQGGTPGLAGADLLEGQREEGGSLLGPPRPLQTLGREAEWSWSGPRCPPLGTIVIADVNTDPAEPEHRALRGAGPDGEVSARVPTSPSGKAPDAGHSRALLSCTPLTGVTGGGRGEAQREDEPPDDILGCFAAFLPLLHETQEPTLGAGDPSPSALETGPDGGQSQVPGPDQEGLGGVCSQPWLSQPTGEKAAERGSPSHKQDLKGLSLSPRACAASMDQEAVGGPPQDAGAGQGNPDTPTGPVGQPWRPADSSKQAIWEGSPAMELDFLPDSQIQDALEAHGFEAPPEQLFPAGGELDPCWPGTDPRADRGSLAEAQPRTRVGIKSCEAASMEDATETVCGLVMELSNLNRLIMSAHRDLETFKRVSYYRKAKPAGKAPTPYTAKGAGTLARGEQSWRDL